MRQEENQYLAIPKEIAMSLDEQTQRLIGYKINAPMGRVCRLPFFEFLKIAYCSNSGWYELRDLLTYLKPNGEVDMTMREFTEREGEELPV
jgi:hypothetical protein